MFESKNYDNINISSGKSADARASGELFRSTYAEGSHLAFHNDYEGPSPGMSHFPSADELLAGVDRSLGIDKSASGDLSLYPERFPTQGAPPRAGGHLAEVPEFANQFNARASRSADGVTLENLTGLDGKHYDMEKDASGTRYFVRKRDGGPDDFQDVSLAVPPIDVEKASTEVLHDSERRFSEHDEAAAHLARLTNDDAAMVNAVSNAISSGDFTMASALMRNVKGAQHRQDMVYALNLELPENTHASLKGAPASSDNLEITRWAPGYQKININLESGKVETHDGMEVGPAQNPAQSSGNTPPSDMPPAAPPS